MKYLSIFILIIYKSISRTQYPTKVLNHNLNKVNNSKVNNKTIIKKKIATQEYLYSGPALNYFNQVKKEVPDYIQSIEKKYEVYVHEVETSDEYINTLWQINPYHMQYKHKFHDVLNDKNKVVYFQHGLACTAETFMVLEADYNWVDFYLKNNWTIFLGNFRGNGFSFKHAFFKENDPNYYEFTIWHHALQDTPAFITKIRHLTKLDKIKYIGFSMGTMTMNIALSESVYVQNTISHYIGLAPILSLKNVGTDLIKKASYYITQHENFVKNILVHRLHFYSFWIPKEMQEKNSGVCNTLKSYHMNFCDSALKLMSDSDPRVLASNNSYYFRTYPSETSYKVMFHFAQLIVSGKLLANYEYGKFNKQIYGVNEAPEINLRNWPYHIKYFFASGSDDLLASVEDMKIFLNELNKNKIEYEHREYKWGHLGFVLATLVDHLMYNTLDILHNREINNGEAKSLDNGKYYNYVERNKNRLHLYDYTDNYVKGSNIDPNEKILKKGNTM